MISMTLNERIITLLMCVLATYICRFLPFVAFKNDGKNGRVIHFLGNYLSNGIFAMLVVYCLKNVQIITGTHGIPEAIAIISIVAVHLWKRNTLLSIAVGTVIYITLLHFVFV